MRIKLLIQRINHESIFLRIRSNISFMKNYIAVATIFLIIVGVFYARSGDSKNVEGAAKLKVGLITPITGPAGAMGEMLVKDVQLYESKYVEFITQDDQCNPKQAISAYNVLRGQGARVFVVACSGSVLALAPIAKTNGDLIITSYAGSSEIRNTGTEVIRFNPDALSVVESLASHIKDSGDKKYALLSEEIDYARSVADGLANGVFKNNPNLLLRETFGSGATDIRTQLTKIKAMNPDVLVFIPASVATAKIVLQQMKDLKLDVHILGEVNLCEYPFSPKDFGFKSTCFDILLTKEQLNTFQNMFVSKFGATSTYPFFDAVTYDVVHVVNDFSIENQKKVKNPVDDKFITDLKKNILDGVAGKIVPMYKFSSEGEVMGDANILKVER